MVEFLKNIHISATTEMVCLLLLGIVFQISDGSPFQIKQQLEKVWSTDLPKEHFAPIADQIIKTVLSIIVAIRCGTTSLYVITSMLVIFCILKDRAPKLMLLWLFIGGVKTVVMTFLEALIGVYVCSAFGKIQKACVEFFISKALEIIFNAYLWGSVLTIYQDMERRMENDKILKNLEISYFKKLDFKRQRARSLLDESTLYKTACLNNFEFKDVPQIILQMLRRPDEISQDSLLGPGMMLASVSNMGSYDSLKISESLGELGYTNLTSTEVVGLDGEENISPQEKALKFLKMTWSDVKRIKESRVPLQTDIFAINSDIWYEMAMSDSRIFKPKQARTEICIREVPPLEFEEDHLFSKKHLKKLYDLRLGMSLFNLIKKYENESESVDTEEEEEEDDEEREDEEMSQIFMSNMKEEKPVNRIRLHLPMKKIRGTAYSKLYTKDFMSVIGPELFDKAPRVMKITSFSLKKINSKRTSSQSSYFKPFKDGILQVASTPFDKTDEYFLPIPDQFEDAKSLRNAEIKTEGDEDEQTGTEEKQDKFEPEAHFSNTEPSKSFADAASDVNFNTCPEAVDVPSTSLPKPKEVGVKIFQKKFRPPCYRKRKIIIRWVGKSTRGKLRRSVSSISSGFSSTSHDSCEFKRPPTTNPDADVNPQQVKKYPSVSSVSSDKCDRDYNENRQVYFLTELLHRPLPEVLKKYYDLKSRVRSHKRLHSVSQKQLEFMNDMYRFQILKKFEETCDFGEKCTKVWKSKVLNVAEIHKPAITGDFLHTLEQDVMNKLLKYQYMYMMSKLKENIVNDMQSLLEIKFEGDQSQEQSSVTTSEASLHSGNDSQHSVTSPDKGRNANETPSDHSIEVCLKDLTTEEKNNSELLSADSRDCYGEEENKTEKTESYETTANDSCSSQISGPMTYCSHAANPLINMKKLMHADHTHHGHKYVRRKGFDVTLDETFPLLLPNQRLMKKLPPKELPTKGESEIKSRPMDLSFAENNSFGWQETTGEAVKTKESGETSQEMETSDKKDKKKTRASNSHHVYFTQDSVELIKKEDQSGQGTSYEDEEIAPVQISSTQLHSNKGRINATYSPALRLEENKKEEKKKAENQRKRKKDMLERLERQIFFQNKNGFDPRKPL